MSITQSRVDYLDLEAMGVLEASGHRRESGNN